MGNGPMHGYPELAEAIRRRIENGEYAAGTYLPSQRALADEFQVNRRTVIRGIGVLASQGLLQSNSTRGSLVVRPNSGNVGGIGLCLDSALPAALRAVDSGSSSMIANGITRRLSEEGLSRTLTWCDPRADQAVPGPAVARQMGLSGLAVWPTLPTTPGAEQRLRVLRSVMPIVLMDRRVPGLETDFVGFDDYDAGRQLARHLVGLGHRRFAFVGWSIPETVHHRLEGAAAVLKGAEISLTSRSTFLSREDSAAEEWFESLIELVPRPTAVICANDLIAVALMGWLAQRGISVPEEMAVVGVGNSVGPMLDVLGLTTVHLPHEDAGYEVADLLLNRLGGRDGNHAPPCERRLPVRLVIRRSCGADTSRPA
ncbi:MAG: substrate-binding domain-containing protein [Fimbriimonas sp.]